MSISYEPNVGLINTNSTTAYLLLFLTSLLFYFLSKDPIRKPKPLPPGPKPWPVVGSLPELYRNKPLFRWVLSLPKNTPLGVACVRLGGTHVIVVDSPTIACEFLKKNDATFATRPVTMATKHSSGFLTVAVNLWGEQWKKMRRVLASEVLSPARLKWLTNKRIEEADNLVRYIYNQCKAESGVGLINVRVAVRQYSGNFIRKMVFNKRYFGEGREDGGPGKEEEEHVDALFEVLGIIYSFCVSDYLPWLRMFDLNGHEKAVKAAVGVVNKYHDPIIEERIRRWRGVGGGSPPPPRELDDLLDVLVSIRGDDGKWVLSEEEIKAQTAELMYATIDNSSNAVEWALAEMLNQPHLLEKATSEIDRVVGKHRLVDESDVPNLTYIKACVRESLRLHPVAPFNLPHVAMSDATVAGYTIPKGSHVLLSRVGLGRNPDVWDDPMKFDPGRHLGEDGSGEVDLTETELRLLSFSTGRRGCMGVQLGTAMTLVLFGRMIQCFEWSVPSGMDGVVDLAEEKNSLYLAKELEAHARPRLDNVGLYVK
ncbi:Tyrosine N-monooxygenase [Acorus gramineus]|uniref:Tyrosine N-monooxygenase n=1 Tax=Acorus gramineus TaxID=55184 RepID=A0AAV9AXS6_ACOGR|nr:Tyrosine N-monooxygenase [Acorus gramineus]